MLTNYSETKGMFGYKACALIRQEDRPAGMFAYDHWLNYQMMVARVAE
jgi:hypothetical protein